MEMETKSLEDAPIKEEEQLTYSYMRLKKENEESQEFQSRAKKQLEKLRKTPVFSKGYIRFKFPDAHILQAAFSPNETMEFVYKFLRDVSSRFARSVDSGCAGQGVQPVCHAAQAHPQAGQGDSHHPQHAPQRHPLL